MQTSTTTSTRLVAGALGLLVLILGTVSISDAYRSGIRARDFVPNPANLPFLLGVLAISIAMTAIPVMLAIRRRRAQTQSWQKEWPHGITHIYFYGDQSLVRRVLSEFAAVVGAEFSASLRPGPVPEPASAVVWHLSDEADMARVESFTFGGPCLLLAKRALAKQARTSCSHRFVFTYPFVMTRMLKRLIEVASAADVGPPAS